MNRPNEDPIKYIHRALLSFNSLKHIYLQLYPSISVLKTHFWLPKNILRNDKNYLLTDPTLKAEITGNKHMYIFGLILQIVKASYACQHHVRL
jgi:hypothetical protein